MDMHGGTGNYPDYRWVSIPDDTRRAVLPQRICAPEGEFVHDFTSVQMMGNFSILPWAGLADVVRGNDDAGWENLTPP